MKQTLSYLYSMKKFHLTLCVCMSIPLCAMSQSATDAYRLSQNDLRGTARFMSMAGAFGALGGDLSCLSQNPGGIGIYRSNEVGITAGLDFMSNEAESRGISSTTNQTVFNLNNLGGVFTLRMPSAMFPNINIGFSYNKVASFARRYNGGIPRLNTSLSNYIAGIANTWDLTEADVKSTGNFDPYNPPSGFRGAPWITILGYDSYLINPEGPVEDPHWYGQFGNGTSGNGNFNVEEKGYVDEYNIAIGGNINNIVFWGLDFGITSIDYRIGTVWGEELTDAYVYNPDAKRVQTMDARWSLSNDYKVSGTGYNFKMGVIVKPVQELRIGLAFHTPTYYSLTENFYNEYVDFNYPFPNGSDYAVTNDGYPAANNIDFQTPWRVIASVAGVIGSKFIISADYEWQGYKNMKYANWTPDDYYWDPWWDYDYPWYYGTPSRAGSAADSYDRDPIGFTNRKIKEIYRDSHTFRIGAEYRVLPGFSARIGYSYTTSPISASAKDNLVDIPGAGTMSDYRLDNETHHITAGLGYKYRGFYADFAYVYKYQGSEYYPFSPDPDNEMSVANSKLKLNTNQIVLSLGYKF
ncbi:MAG: outer membrane protein transport protein [Candidatus Amulumruptor caecigallinarius]|nr:outer membrane protein transport protein [Candidatus Amulumruptor caecigallinarius]